MPSALRRSMAGRDHRAVLLAERAVLAGVRIEAGDREPRMGDAETVAQIARHDTAGLEDQIARERCGTSLSGRWIVTGTTASSGDHSIITGCTADAGRSNGQLGEDIRYGRARRSPTL